MVFLKFTAILLELYFMCINGHITIENIWTYDGYRGPKYWYMKFPSCRGRYQSPININTSEALVDVDLPEFDLSQLTNTEGVHMKLENVHGHTVEVSLSGANLYVTGGGLHGQYAVQQFHFHWGADDVRGSEHSIDNTFYPGEMHIVLYSAFYRSITKALKKPNGVAVLGFFFKVGKYNIHFDRIISYFSYIAHKDQQRKIKTFSLKTLLPPSAKTYYRYFGSLTTPPCSETIVWSLFDDAIEISEEQLEKFRNIKRNRMGLKEVLLVDDFRPLQKLNERTITTNRKFLMEPQALSSAHACYCGATLLVTLLFTSLLTSI